MAERKRFRLVEVEASTNVVIADFGRKKSEAAKQRSCVSVLLNETDLELTGEEFVETIRKALFKMLDEGRPVVLFRGDTVDDRDGRQTLGMRLDAEDIEQIEIKDTWRFAS